MKNLISLFVLALILVFTSCTKEDLIIEETVSIPSTEASNKTMHPSKLDSESITTSSANSNKVAVSHISSTISGNELIINFSSAYNFFGIDLATTQSLAFTDANGNTVLLHFDVNSYTYNNGVLEVAFGIGGNSMLGMQVEVAQFIIIDDILIN